MELQVALETWLARIPEFSLADPAAVTWSTGQIRGPRRLPLRLGAPQGAAQASVTGPGGPIAAQA